MAEECEAQILSSVILFFCKYKKPVELFKILLQPHVRFTDKLMLREIDTRNIQFAVADIWLSGASVIKILVELFMMKHTAAAS